jgi:signal peptidase I
MTRRPALRDLRIALWIVLGAFVLGAVWLTRFGTRWPTIYTMTGPSMEPTLSAGEYFIAWNPAGTLRRGDLVIFRFIDEDGEKFDVLRRLVGVPGDTVSMTDGEVLVNGEPHAWPYRVSNLAAWRSELAIEGHLFTWGPWVVPADSVVLLADLRDMLGWPDSRFVGFVAQADIVARATRTVWGKGLR